MTDHLGFRIGDVFQPGDVLGEWVVTIAMAANDCTFAASIVFGEAEPGEQSYGARLAVAHLYEIGKFLDATANLPAVQQFITTLGEAAATDYALVLGTYRTYESRLAAQRSNAIFHYPVWKAKRRNVTKALRACADSVGIVRVGETVGERRYIFADELASALLEETSPGGADQLPNTLKAASDALGAFATFADTVVGQYVLQKQPDLSDYKLSEDRLGWVQAT